MKLVKQATYKPTAELIRSAFSKLIHELRQLTQLIQAQLAVALRVFYETINREENGDIQPSPLAMKQIRSFIDKLEVWREIWDQVGSQVASAMLRNEGTYDEALLLMIEHNGYLEETYYPFSNASID